MLGGRSVSISYAGGDGNDVVLSAVGPPQPPQVGVTITGTNQADTVNATQTVAGQPMPTAFGDVINGRGGNDRLGALAGNDQIYGGKGKDQLFGGPVADFLSGGAGKNKLTGGGDADSFGFNAKLGKGKGGTGNKSSFAKITDSTTPTWFTCRRGCQEARPWRSLRRRVSRYRREGDKGHAHRLQGER